MLPSPSFNIPSIGTPHHALEEDQMIAPQAQEAQHQNRYSFGGFTPQNMLSTGQTPTNMLSTGQTPTNMLSTGQTPNMLSTGQTPQNMLGSTPHSMLASGTTHSSPAELQIEAILEALQLRSCGLSSPAYSSHSAFSFSKMVCTGAKS